MKAIIEAEKYDGPSLILAYAPCITMVLKLVWVKLKLKKI